MAFQAIGILYGIYPEFVPSEAGGDMLISIGYQRPLAGSGRRRGGWGIPTGQFEEGIPTVYPRTRGAEREALRKYACDASPLGGTVHASVKLQMKDARDDN
eukprot:54407-Pleurochrysis_carterae.AAC.1